MTMIGPRPEHTDADGKMREFPMDGLPENVQRVLEGFVQSAQSAFGQDLVSVVLYGSAAEGRMRTTSDVNVIVVLSRFDGAAAKLIRDPLNLAETAVQLRAMFLLAEEIGPASEAFARSLRTSCAGARFCMAATHLPVWRSRGPPKFTG